MASAPANLTLAQLCVGLCMSGALCLGGCANAPGAKAFALGGVDANSSVAEEVSAASRSPGPYPKVSKIPSAPTDLRPSGAWKAAVVSEWAQKRELEASAAAIPFSLSNTAQFAAGARAKISSDLAVQAPADAEAQASAFADAERARATPPPKAD